MAAVKQKSHRTDHAEAAASRGPPPRKVWRGRSGRLLERYNHDWVLVRRSLDRSEPPPAAGAAGTAAVYWPAALFPHPPRIAVAPSLW